MTFTINSTVSDQIYLNYTPVISAEMIHRKSDKKFLEFSTHARTYLNIRASGSLIRRGIIEWDVTELPDNATIEKVAMLYQNYMDNVSTVTNPVQIHAFTDWQPSIVSDNSSASDIWVQIGSSATYAPWAENIQGAPAFPTTYFPQHDKQPNQYIILGDNDYNVSTATAITDLTNQLTSNWFAVGLRADDEVTNQNSANILTTRYQNPIPAPTLWVKYKLNKTITLRDAEHIDRDQQRNMQNPAGSIPGLRPHDVGATNRQITITGLENVNAAATLEDIRVISTIGEYITISGLPDSDLNGEYVIKTFRYTKEPGKPGSMRYTLVLERYTMMNVYKFFED